MEVGPRLFVPPEDDSYSVDFAMEVINRAYPGCTGMYLDRAGHMLAFYGQRGSTRAGLIQDVVIKAGRAVGELPTWMGYTARWRVRCVSLAEANEILPGARGWRRRTGGENVCSFKNCLPLCTRLATSQLMPFLSSCRLHCQPLGQLGWLEVFRNEGEMGPHLTFPHLIEPQVLH